MILFQISKPLETTRIRTIGCGFASPRLSDRSPDNARFANLLIAMWPTQGSNARCRVRTTAGFDCALLTPTIQHAARLYRSLRNTHDPMVAAASMSLRNRGTQNRATNVDEAIDDEHQTSSFERPSCWQNRSGLEATGAAPDLISAMTMNEDSAVAGQ